MSLRAALSALLAAAFLLGGAGVASAHDDEGPWLTMRLTSNTVCVKPDFVVTGSGYRIHQAVANWNAAQDDVDIYVGDVPGCSEVVVHRYYSKADGAMCGFVDYSRTWASVALVDGAWRYAGADIYLNDACPLIQCGAKAIVAHELGHALGLPHSRGTSSIMSYAYDCATHHGAVGISDARALWNLYG